MKKASVFIIVIILFFLACDVSSNIKKKSSFEGYWSWVEGSENQDFSIEIIEKSNNYIGTYTAVAYNGNRIDTGFEDEISFKFPNSNNSEVIVKYLSYYSGGKGKVKLILKNNYLYWEVIKEPEGLFYYPKKAKLKFLKNK